MAVIEAKQEQFRVDYVDEVLPALFKKQNTDSDFSESLLRINPENAIDRIEEAKSTLLIAVEHITNQRVIRALQNKADDGVRVYLLLGDELSNKAAIDGLVGRCLIRTGVSQKGGLILVDHATNTAMGLLLTNGLVLNNEDHQTWATEMDPTQIGDSFRSFCKLFWEETKREFKKPNEPRATVAHPDGKIVTNHSHQLSGTLQESLSDALESLAGASHCSFGASGTYSLLLNVTSTNIIFRQGVCLTEQSTPSLLFSDKGNWLLPDETDFVVANWCLRLSGQQSQTLFDTYDKAIEQAAWQYSPPVKMGEVEGKQALRFAEQPDIVRQIERFRTKDLKPVLTSTIDSFLRDEPEELTRSQTVQQPDYLAHQIDYNVIIHPPYCPKSAVPDEIYANWEKAEDDWLSHLLLLEQKQERIDERQKRIADKLKEGLRGFLLGQEQSVKKLNKELAELKRWSVKRATPAERRLNHDRLLTLIDEICKREENTLTEISRAEHEQRWNQKKEQLQKQHQEAESIIENKKRRFEELRSEKNSRQAEAKEKFLQRWHQAVEGLSDDQVAKIKKEKSRLLELDFENACELRLEVKEKNFKKHYSAMNRAIEDYEYGIDKIERDINSAKSELDSANKTLESVKQQLKLHGSTFKDTPLETGQALEKQLGIESAESTSHTLLWPDTELPSEGSELKTDGNQRWLVISHTEQLAQARIDAERLNATICVDSPKGGVGNV